MPSPTTRRRRRRRASARGGLPRKGRPSSTSACGRPKRRSPRRGRSRMTSAPCSSSPSRSRTACPRQPAKRRHGSGSRRGSSPSTCPSRARAGGTDSTSRRFSRSRPAKRRCSSTVMCRARRWEGETARRREMSVPCWLTPAPPPLSHPLTLSPPHPLTFAFLSDGEKGRALQLKDGGTIQMDGFGVFRFVATDVVSYIKDFTRLLTLSPSHPLTFSPSHPLTFSPSHIALLSERTECECAWQIASPSASAASFCGSSARLRSVFTIRCTCSFSASPFPQIAFFIRRGSYS